MFYNFILRLQKQVKKLIMNKLILTIASCFFSFFVNAQNKYSIEVGSGFGIPSYNSFKKFDNTLATHLYPKLNENLNFVSFGNTDVVFRINHWGILLKGNWSAITTQTKESKYYDGFLEYSSVGAMYDLVATPRFSVSPYVGFDTKAMETYLDYEFKDSVIPTSLHIKGVESGFTIGSKFYARINSWKENKYQLFLNLDAYYSLTTFNKWRLNNMLIKSTDFDLSHFGISAGVNFRFSLN